jgi:arginyl-tRNA synthetase
MPAFRIAIHLEYLLSASAAGLGWDKDFSPDLRTADPRFGDYQANGVLPFAKRSGRNPRELANALCGAFLASQENADRFEASVAGPGFLNLRLKPAALLEWLGPLSSGSALATAAAGTLSGRIVVVDYSSPNTAKQMHVGHLRSAVIGESICRLLEFSGAKVVRDNHIGDWGTQFGKLIWAYKRHLDAAALAQDAIEEFERLYTTGNTAATADPAVLEEARQELVRLQQGDPENLSIWKRINDASLEAFQKIYDRLGIHFDLTLGESFYNDKVARVYTELEKAGLATISEGALVVFHPEHPRYSEQPFIVRKSDGAANYASSDLATILYRREELGADQVIVVTDPRQKDHFEQLFLTARKWFEATGRTLPQLEHVTFGAVLGDNGKPLKTRDGGTIRLKDLLDEAANRAFDLVSTRSPEIPELERRAIAEVVGVGSVQYADLSQNRSGDYLFSWDKMISLEGNTAAYLLYQVARMHSLFRNAGVQPGSEASESGATPPDSAGELALARKLVQFPDALRQALDGLRPHFLATYLYELSGTYSAFWQANRVLDAEPDGTRQRRLLLSARTLFVLEAGLGLLGLRTLTRM